MTTHTEMGNVALTDGSSSVLWIVEDGVATQEVSYTPDNYPAWYVDTAFNTPIKEVVEHINEHLVGWYVQKNNAEGICVDEHGEVFCPSTEE